MSPCSLIHCVPGFITLTWLLTLRIFIEVYKIIYIVLKKANIETDLNVLKVSILLFYDFCEVIKILTEF